MQDLQKCVCLKDLAEHSGEILTQCRLLVQTCWFADPAFFCATSALSIDFRATMKSSLESLQNRQQSSSMRCSFDMMIEVVYQAQSILFSKIGWERLLDEKHDCSTLYLHFTFLLMCSYQQR